MIYSIPVCITNNHLASLYNLLADDDKKAKFLTSEDLQVLGALITYYYGRSKDRLTKNFTINPNIPGASTMECVPYFCPTPYRPENERLGEEYKLPNDYIQRYRYQHKKCIGRHGAKGQNSMVEMWAEFISGLEKEKKRNTQIAGVKADQLDFVARTAEDSINKVINAVGTNFITQNEATFGVSVQQSMSVPKEEKRKIFCSQIYTMKQLGSDEEKMNALNSLIDLLGEYFKLGCPYLLYNLNSLRATNLRLNFGAEDKQKFIQAFKQAIDDFTNYTPRVKLNNENYDVLQGLIVQESAGERN